MKRLILVTSPPACGKTYISKQLAKALKHVVYLDKDTLICLSHQIFKVVGELVNRSSQFFEENIRDYEYEAVVALAMEALDYEDIVLINAPFTREIRDKQYIEQLKSKLKEKDAKLTIVWVETSVEVCKQRMVERNSERDTWKLAHWDEYIAGCNFEVPEALDNPEIADDLLIFKNSSEEEFQQSLLKIVKILEAE
ncbi:AAA family ATPase [Anaeromicropila populeti]|uniref:Shikimate kinase n=1 Tax=Anaeromicropila populeti TaxID=37658 RepID=A0A1I6HPG1_9FIRM|nr:AAA family ATPase [Anaeromicropila populeti]SFR56336.1 shikimate kinase [Anaeromicropila populeti]